MPLTTKNPLREKQPKEMYLLALTEMCQRFAFWGVGSLLVLYLVQLFHLSDKESTRVYGIFTAAAFVLPLLGGYIADRTSHVGAVILGSLFTSFGCFLLAFNSASLLYPALILVALGAALFTPSIYTILGSLYKQRPNLREGGFSIYYSSVNVGVFLASFILGFLAHIHLWTVAFLLAASIQLLGLFLFWFFLKKRPHLSLSSSSSKEEKKEKAKPLKPVDKDRIFVICILSFVSIVFWMAYNQGFSSMTLFALRDTKRDFGSFHIPTVWFSSLESLYLILLAFPLSALYRWLGKYKKDPSPPLKTAFSLFSIALCFLLLLIASLSLSSTSSLASPFYLVFAYLFMAIGEMLIAPIGLSLVTHLSPHKYTAFLVGVWYVCIGVAFYIGGELAGLISSLSLVSFFSIFVISASLFGAILLSLVKKLNQLRHLSEK